MIRLDFETRAQIDLKNAGASQYSKHCDTRVLCLAYKIDGQPTQLWHRAHRDVGVKESPRPTDLIDAIRSGMLVEAHNAAFERYIWANTFMREFPWLPPIENDKWRCSASKCAALSLPRKLENSAKALDLPVQKDMDGHRLMLKLTKPKPKNSKQISLFEESTYYEDLNELEKLWEYCKRDVDTEFAVSSALRDLSPIELKVWQMDQEMNERGVTCDQAMATKAVKLVEEAKENLNAELARITDGKVLKGSNRGKFKAWVSENGLELVDTQSKTVEKLLLKDDLPSNLKRALEICISVNKTSTAKYNTLINQVSDDGRLRDTQLYHGSHTGRWTAKGLQLQNLTRGFGRKEMPKVCEDIVNFDCETIEMLWGNPMDVLSKAVRGCLVASPGKKLYVADYASIEARVLLWLAEDEEGLDIFRQGKDIYKFMASSIYKKPIDMVDDDDRFIGKQAVLGLGYSMGADKFLDSLIKFNEEKLYKIFKKNRINKPLAFCKNIIKVYREEKFTTVPKLWYATEAGAIEALKTGEAVQVNKCKWKVIEQFLHCQLPSGRLLSYFKPSLRKQSNWFFPALTRSGEKTKITILTNSESSKNYALKLAQEKAEESQYTIIGSPVISEKETLAFMTSINGRYVQDSTYGGKLVENITQGVARDFLAEAMLDINAHPDFDLLFSVHDESVVEAKEKEGNLQEFESLMTKKPAWADGCPIQVEGWEGYRYLK